MENLFALSSVLTPFTLATVMGAIATGRVPVGNACGDLVTPWLNPVSVLAGVLAVALPGYLGAVYLAAGARRLTERTLAHDFRTRARGRCGRGRPGSRWAAGDPRRGRAALARAAGVGLLVFADPAWAHGVGAVCLLGCAVPVFALAVGPPEQS